MSALHHFFFPRESNNHRAKLLHPSSFIALIGIFLGFQLLLGQLSTRLPEILGYASQIPPQEIVRLTNDQRRSHGRPALQLDGQLSQAAALKAADMFARDYWAHVSPIGTQPWFFVTEVGYNYRYAGENLARDFSASQSVVDAWMASPTHSENLLSDRYQDIGVAVVDGRLGGRDTTLVVQFFGTRISAPPSVGGTSSFTVQAAGEPFDTPTPPQPTFSPAPPPLTSPFDITKAVSLGLLAVIICVLIIDVVTVRKRRIVRWTSKSLAHLIFISVLLVAAMVIIRGQIL